jgi:hypothetical protein
MPGSNAMTFYNDQNSPHALRLIFRISLAMLVMVLAERAAKLSHGEPGLSNESSAEEKVVQPNYTSPTTADEDSPTVQRLREGTVLTDAIGRFKVSGDRATFVVTETGQTFGGLENLNLSRIFDTIRDDPNADWNVSGSVTEYRGLNFLLIHKAVRKTNSNEALGKSSFPVSSPLSDSDESPAAVAF